MNREACCLQLGQLTGANWSRSFCQWLHTEKETTAPHDRTKTQPQRTIDWTKNILIFSTSKLTKTISPTVWQKLNVDFFNFIFLKGSVTRCSLLERLFSTIQYPKTKHSDFSGGICLRLSGYYNIMLLSMYAWLSRIGIHGLVLGSFSISLCGVQLVLWTRKLEGFICIDLFVPILWVITDIYDNQAPVSHSQWHIIA